MCAASWTRKSGEQPKHLLTLDGNSRLEQKIQPPVFNGGYSGYITKGEMMKYRVPGLLESYQQQGFTVYHHPFPDGSVPDIASCWKILEELRICLENEKRILIQCYGGLGRSCLIAACLLLQLSDTILPEDAIGHLRELRGAAAIQTVKQYNYLYDFRDNVATYLATKEDAAARSVSR
ncbi:cyclin-dependent kinase inhibitor 3-like [Scyliorhinus canicula]|uniref:cyclin-dependent kinase inhibitor 3-like n=1 Tax=Scyliorhinus canicula TaxID=7830 RepID=UPI0018F60688|nr:cyclin-dependent kinase inhibitor 3-like [Scyliorhinus canicula]